MTADGFQNSNDYKVRIRIPESGLELRHASFRRETSLVWEQIPWYGKLQSKRKSEALTTTVGAWIISESRAD
jgi:hypothetical protein